jgi:hypothetical protein
MSAVQRFVCGGAGAALLFVLLVSASPAERVIRSTRDCDAYAYCQGQTFPNDVMLNSRKIKCDGSPSPHDRCCLPQARHFVCYDIKVDGLDLNFDSANNAKSTDFTGLCSAMAQTRGNRTGKHSSAVIANGGGRLVWRYGEWSHTDPGTQHVENLACEILL